jgi:hypothetical protein
VTNYTSPHDLSIDDQLSEIHALIEGAKLIGCTVSGLLVKELNNAIDEQCLLCIFQDCTNGVVRGDAGIPVFPAFYSMAVAQALMERQLAEIVDFDERNRVNRYFVKFSENWV